MKEKGMKIGPGSMIHYIIIAGEKRIRDKAMLPEEVKEGDYDPDYYINNQIIPAVESIFNVLGYKDELRMICIL